MKRRLLNLLTALSLLLCVAACVLWVRSYWTVDLIVFSPTRDSYSVWSQRGEVCLRRLGNTDMPDRWQHHSTPVQGFSRYVPPQSERRRPGGFWWESGALNFPRPLRYQVVVVPYWFILAVCILAASPALLRRRRHRVGLCPTCGYDLRATPDRCPECGAVP
jgi:hypothetical protein